MSKKREGGEDAASLPGPSKKQKTLPNLWTCDDLAVWESYRQQYPALLAARLADSRALMELDGWVRTEYPAGVSARNPMHATVDEVARVVTWKMMRGTWRPRNKGLALANDPDAVVAATADALEALQDLDPDADLEDRVKAAKAAVKTVSSLGGIGPATASAILAWLVPEIVPFFDKPMAQGITNPPLPPVQYSLSFFSKYASRILLRADQLQALQLQQQPPSASSASSASSPPPLLPWTPQSVSQTLWAYAASRSHLKPNARVPKTELSTHYTSPPSPSPPSP